MNHTMKNVIRAIGVAAGLAAAVWALRDRMLPDPLPPDESPPKFRTGAPDHDDTNAPASDPDDLTAVNGIGPAYASRLNEAGITTLDDLAAATAADVAEAANTTESAAAGWIDDAAALR